MQRPSLFQREHLLRFDLSVSFMDFANKYNILRLGAKIDDFQKPNFATLGWGFNGPRLRLNYSFEKPLKQSNGAMHSVDLLVAF